MLSVSVPASKAEGKPVMYVVCTVAAGQRWVVERRFSAFLTLHEELEGIDPAFTERAVLPPKSWFVSDAMVEARRVLFHKYLEDALESPTISRHPRLLAFLGLTAADMDGLRTSAPSVGSLGDGDGSPVEEDVRTKKPAAAAPKRPAGRSKVAHASPELTSAREQVKFM